MKEESKIYSMIEYYDWGKYYNGASPIDFIDKYVIKNYDFIHIIYAVTPGLGFTGIKQ